MASDIDAALDVADFATRKVTVCLKGSLQAEWDDAEAQVKAAQAMFDAAVEAKGSTAAQAAARQEALEALAAVEERWKAASIEFTFTGRSTADWNGVILKHPPREGYAGDQYYGFDTAGAFPELVRLAMVEPALSDEQFKRLMAAVTDKQFDQLVGATLACNRQSDGSLPFSLTAYVATLPSDETSESPSTSESAPAGSGDGPHRRSPKGSAKKASGTSSR